MDKIRILVADDTEETRSLVSRYLEFNDRFELVGTAENGKKVIEMIATLNPDVVLSVTVPSPFASKSLIPYGLPRTART